MKSLRPSRVRFVLALLLPVLALVAAVPAKGQTAVDIYPVEPPCRAFDSRFDTPDDPAIPPTPGGAPNLTRGTVYTVTLTGPCGYPTTVATIPPNVDGLAITVAVLNAANAGSLVFYPAGGTAPSPSEEVYNDGLSFPGKNQDKFQHRTKSFLVELGEGGAVSFFANLPGNGKYDLHIDVTGYFTNAEANADTATVLEDAAATAVPVLDNDSDPDDPLVIASATQPANGTVVVAPDGLSLTYQPNPNYCNTQSGGTPDTFFYSLDSGVSAQVSMTVTCENDPPVLTAGGTLSYTEGQAATAIDNTITVADVDDTHLESATVTITAGYQEGADVLSFADTATISGSFDVPSGTLTLTGSDTLANWDTALRSVLYNNTSANPTTATRTVTWIGDDGEDPSAGVTSTITVGAENDVPEADDDSYSVDEAGTLNIAAPGVLDGDTDGDSDPLTAVLVAGPAHAASFTLNADGSFNYVHDGSETTSDSFTYRANDGTANSAVATVTITINALNDAPVADDDSYSVDEGGTLNIAAPGVLDGDTDGESSPLTAVLVAGPANAASFTLNADGSFNYVHNGSETTSDSFTYQANDGTVNSATATVTITVNALNDIPVADDDSYSVDEGGTLSIAAPGVLDGDTDGESSPLTAVLVAGPAHAASFALNANGSFSYVHNGSETTSDSFTYRANDGTANSAIATVTITINALNDVPVADNDSYSVDEGGTLNISAPGVLDGDTDGEASPLTAVLVAGPAHAASFTLNANGSFSYVHNGSETTSDSFTYRANDGTTNSAIATVTITINAINDLPVANNDGYTLDEGATLSIPVPGVLGNDTDGESSPLTAVLVAGPAQASSFALNANGSFSYTHNGSETTSDSFSYRANDGTADSALVATVSFTINPVNDPPTAQNDSAATDEDTPIAILVRGNDSDPEGPLTIISIGGSPAASVSHDGSQVTYNPTVAFNSLPQGASATDTFTYTVQDSGGLTATATVTVSVAGLNDAPIADDEVYAAIGNTRLAVQKTGTFTEPTYSSTLAHVLNGDIDPDTGDTLTAVAFSGALPGGAFLELSTDGTFFYTPPAGQTTGTFTYTVRDALGATDTGTVTVNLAKMVWYVRNTANGGAVNTGSGTSTDPFSTLSDGAGNSAPNDAEDASAAGHVIYVFQGSGTANLTQGIALKNGQKLLGEGVHLEVDPDDAGPETLQRLFDGAPAKKPQLASTADNVTVLANTANGNRTGIEIRGLQLSSSAGNAIDLTAANAVNLDATIDDVVIGGSGLEGIDVNANTTGTTTVTVTNSNLTATGNAFDARTGAVGALRIGFSNNKNILSNASGVVIDGSGGGVVTITGFADNSVHQSTVGAGISVNAAVFDATPGGAINRVYGGDTQIGVTGDGVGGAGLVLTNVTGDLAFGDGAIAGNLDIYSTGTALQATSTLSGGVPQFRLTTMPDVARLVATSGAAVDLDSVTADLHLESLTSTNGLKGVSLVNVRPGSPAATFPARFRAPSGSSITTSNAGATAFRVDQSNATVEYAGTVTATAGTGVNLTSNTGSTIDFSGTLTLSTGANPAFAATGGGTVTATDPASMLTTATGTALNVSDTSIGTNGLTFRRISSNGAVNGIRISNTGATGFLTVTGTGSDDSGGSITNSTQDGVFLNGTRSITLNEMTVSSSAQSHIEATSVNGLTLNGIETDLSTDHGIFGNGITNLMISGGTFHRGGAGAEPACNKDGVNIANLLGASSVTGVTFTRSNTRQFYVTNTTASGAPDTLTVSGTTWGTHTGPCSGDHLSVAADTGGNLKLVTNSNSGENNFSGGGIGVQAVANGSGTLQASITGVETSGNTAGVAISGTGNGNVSFRVYDNRSALGTGFTGTGSVALILTCTTAGTCQGAFEGNSISHTAGTSTNAMQVVVEGNGTGRVTVANNTVSGNFQRGLQGQSRSGTGSLSLNVTGNNFTATDAGGLQVMNFEVGASGGGTTNSLCLNLAGNTATPAGGMTAYRLLHRAGYTYQLQNLTQASTTNAADVQTWVSTTKANAGAPVAVTVGSTAFTTTAGCATPTLPTP